MANIDIYKQYENGRKILPLLTLPLLFGFSDRVQAFDWIIRPSLNIREVFSDNINQDSNNKQSALVTEVSPSVSVRSTSSINTFDLNYRMQNLYNAGGNSGLDINNQLQLNSKYQFVRNSLFMDTRSSISQQNISNRNIVSDNLTGNSNTSNITTFSISPYWTPNFKNFASGIARVTYNRVSASGGPNSFSNTNSFNQNFSLNSGRDFSRVTWFVNFNNQEQFNDNGNDVKFQSSTAELRTFFNRKLSAFIRVGQQSNQFQTTTDSNQNGFFYTAGGQWRPSARFSVQAGYGNNAFVTVNILPIRRITWSTTYFNNDIGTNRGSRWQSSLNYNARRSIWGFTYSENTVTTQQLLLQQQVFFVNDAFGNRIRNPITGQPVLFTINLPTLTDEVFISKRADLSVSFQTGRSTINFNGYRSRRIFQVSQNIEDVYGFSSSWNWNFMRRSSSNVRLLWQTTDGQEGTSDERFEATVGVTRNIVNFMESKGVNGLLEYRYISQQSGLAGNDFSENRISASLFMRF